MENTTTQGKTKTLVRSIQKRLRYQQQYSPFWELLDVEFALKGRKAKRLHR